MLVARKYIICFIEKGTFPYKGNVFKTKEESEEESEEELEEESEEELEKTRDDYKIFIEYIENESKGINYDLFKDYFDLEVSSALATQLYETKNKNRN